jgi:hypothetical protein
VDGALLVSCPCDLGAWRQFMMKKQNNNPIWTAPIHALSPQDLAGAVSPATHVAVLVGAEDDVAPPSMSTAYAETLKQHVSHVTLTIAPGSGARHSAGARYVRNPEAPRATSPRALIAGSGALSRHLGQVRSANPLREVAQELV